MIPYAYDDVLIKTSETKKLMKLINDVNQDLKVINAGPADIVLHYDCPGNCLDYVYIVEKVPYAYA